MTSRSIVRKSHIAAQSGLGRRIRQQLAPYAPRLVVLLVVDLLATPLLLLSPVPLKIVVDSVLGNHPIPKVLQHVPTFLRSTSFRVLILAAVLQVLIVLLAEVQDMTSYIMHSQLGEKITLQLRAHVFRHAQRLSILYHDRRGTADSVYRVQWDAPSIQWLTTDGILPLGSSLLTLAVTIYVIARLSWPLALVALVVCPFLYLLARFYNLQMRPRYARVKGLESDALHVVQEVLGALRIVKAFGREEREEERFLDRSGAGASARIRLAIAEGAFGMLVNVTTAAGTAAVLFVGVRQVQSHVLTTGELLMVIAYLAQLYAPLKTISRQAASLQSSLASAERVFQILDLEPDVAERHNPRPLARAEGRIEFQNVAFAYEPNHPVLREVSFSVEPGARLGIAGRTGAGKTTLVSLLTRFFDPTEGCIMLDGVDIRDYRLADLRSQFSIVPQDPVLFSTSIRENISYARPDATDREIEDAARSANAHEFIRGLPEGYDTLVGERGMRLSGGERQRVALARAFLKDAPLLVLDEPTSSVDVRTEAGIVDAMNRLMGGRTTLMIAHRLSTLEICDRRIEVEGGTVVVPPRSTSAHRAARRHHVTRD